MEAAFELVLAIWPIIIVVIIVVVVEILILNI